MKIVLIKDVYKLGRAGEIKKVAAGYARNFLIPRGFAIPATPGALQQAERIKIKATERRAALNEELGDVAEVLDGKTLTFAVKAGETGRLYGSVSDDDILKAIHDNFEIELEKRQIETEPIRILGSYQVPVHLTMDLIPTINILVHQEGEIPGEETPESEAELVSDTTDSADDAAETEEYHQAETESEETDLVASAPEGSEDSEAEGEPEA